MQEYYDAGHSVRECARAFGFSPTSWHSARQRGDIEARRAAMPIAELLVPGRDRSRINGVSNDNRLENLRLLCPNCHAGVEDEAAGRSATG